MLAVRLFGFLGFSILFACGGGGGGSGPAATSNTPASSSTLSTISSLQSTTSSAATSSATSSSFTSQSTSLSSISSSSSSSSSISVTAASAFAINAGKDQFAVSGDRVTVSGSVSGSTGTLTYQWTQVSGPSVVLSGAAGASASFTVPTTSEASKILLKVTASAEGKVVTDSVVINVVDKTQLIRLEAEGDTSVTRTSLQVSSALSGYSGTGYVTGFDGQSADSIQWNLQIEKGGYYRINLGYQVASYKEFDFVLDFVTSTGKMPFIDSGFHSTTVGTFYLGAGIHTLVVKGGWSWYNLDYIELMPVAAPVKPQAVDSSPSDPNANTKTKALYSAMVSHYGAKALSGQQDIEETSTIFNETGKYPAILAWDLSVYGKLFVNAMGEPKTDSTKIGTIEDFIGKVNARGHVASLIWHWLSPVGAKNTTNPCPTYPTGTADADKHCWWNAFNTVHTNLNLTSVLSDPSSNDYKELIADIDRIAVPLKKMQEANISVLWRPLHEADGGWFWWGAAGSESYIKLWRLLHDRLTNFHGLHNLIWVYSLGKGDLTWYPGDDVVDFVGTDEYPSDKHSLLTASWEPMFERFDGHKMLVLSEFGGVPFIGEMQAKGIWWGYFASWNDRDTSNPLGPKKMTTDELKAVYQSDSVVTLDELGL